MLNYEPCLKSGSGAAQRVYAETVFAEEYTIFPFNAVCLLGASYRGWVNAQGSYRGSLLLRLCPSITQSDLISCILLYPQLSNVYGPVFFLSPELQLPTASSPWRPRGSTRFPKQKSLLWPRASPPPRSGSWLVASPASQFPKLQSWEFLLISPPPFRNPPGLLN